MNGQRIGYVRVSSFDPNQERQLEQVRVDKVFTDKASGKDTQWPELDALLPFVREGDTVAESTDRSELPEGLSVPAEIARREDQLSAIAAAKAKLKARVEKAAKTGRKPPGKPPALAGAFQRAHAAGRRCQCGRHDEAHAQDPGGQTAIRTAQADGGTGVRHHQVGDEVQAVHAAGFDQRRQRMDAGLSGVEFETAGRIAPAIRPANVKPDERRRMRVKCSIEERKVIKKCANSNRGGQCARSTASSRTGC